MRRRPLRFVALPLALLATLALFTGCSNRPAFVSGEVTSVSPAGDRLCIDTSLATDKTHVICGNRPPSDEVNLAINDCYRARWGSRHEGRFTDVQYAGHCKGMPAASK